MAITKKLVDQMHGSLDVESEPGEGTPIIAMTANAFAEDERQALACGMNAHVAKPIDVHALERVVAKLSQ